MGLSLLVVLASFAVRLPGDAVTAAIACALAVLAAVVLLVRDGMGRPDPAVAAAGVGVSALTALPFLASGRVGLPGVSLNNDTSVHLLWSEGMRSDAMARLYPLNPGYPLGPHSLMATVAEGTGVDMDRVMVGLLIASPVLLGVMVAAALRPAPAVLRAPAAVVVALSYLSAAWYGQGAFKEPLMSLLLIGFALGLRDLLHRDRGLGLGAFIPLALIAAGGILIYSYLAVAWFAATAGLTVVLAAAVHRWRPARILRGARSAALPAAVGAGVALAAVAVELPRLATYLRDVGASPAEGSGGIAEQDLGNLAGPLPAAEGLGVWPAGDFRFAPAPETFLFEELKLLALFAVVGGALFLIARGRHIALVAALAAAALLYVLSERGQSPYVAAKGLVVLAPLVMLVTMRALLPERLPRAAWARGFFAARIAVAFVIGAAGLWSAERVLRGSPVESTAHRDALAELRPIVEPGPTLFLGIDDYAGWRLREVPLAYFGGFPSPVGVAAREDKPYEYGNQLDWDSFDAATLDRFRYVVTPRSPADSSAPPSFRLVAAIGPYEAWERTTATAPREILETADSSAAPLDCSTPPGRRIARARGVAGVTPDRVPVQGGLPPLLAGQAQPVTLSLPPGSWSLAVKYTSPVTVRLQTGPVKVARLPATTSRPGPWWSGGRVRSDGRPQQLLVIPERESRLTTTAFPGSLSGIVAVRDGAVRTVPLARACGRLVDWYRQSA